MDERRNLEILETVLRRIDNNYIKIKFWSPHCHLYYYRNKCWEDSGIKGPLFFFGRNKIPHNRIIILNKDNIQNWSILLNDSVGYKINEDFIIIKRGNGPICYGLWFAKMMDAVYFAKLLDIFNKHKNQVDLLFDRLKIGR
ncbi:mRNA-decapping enzyme 1B [Astathelohania contejeani]|uniref:mRNA-decapping enzyme 1B n=1 Tax=Astathelohania contejeani TaxID=164912 RepID=A0ABQ7I1I1_9MICR|nr:mRNA-decapping enzyme 1B [Thelohania contejeani]